MSHFNLKGTSSIFLMRIIWYSLIAGVVVFYFKQEIVTHPQVNLSLHTARPELIQIFCDAGNGFNETLSSSVTTSTAQQNGEPFSLSLPSSCKRLRLDLGDSGSIVEITSAALFTSGGDNVDILSKIILPALLNETKVSESNKNEFISTGNDPYVVLNGEYSVLTKTGYSSVTIFKILGIFSFVIGVAALMNLVAKKYNFKVNSMLTNKHTSLIIVVIAAASLRIDYWRQSMLPSEPSQLGRMWPDEGSYFAIAQYIMTHGLRDYFFAEQSVVAAPANPIYIALMYTIFNSVNSIRALNLALSVFSIVLIYKLGNRIFNKPVGLLAAGICAVHGQLIQYSATLLTEPLFLSIFTAGIFYLVCILDTRNLPSYRYRIYAFVSAVLLTIAILTRSIAMLLPIFLLATIGSREAYYSFRLRTPSFPLLKRAALPLLLPLLIVGIVATKNYVFFDRFMVATGSGAALWLGSRSDTEGDEPAYRGKTYDTSLITNGAPHNSLQGDLLLMGAAKANIVVNPLNYAWWNVKKVGRLLIGSNLAWFYPYKNIGAWYRATGRNFIDTSNILLQIFLASGIAVYGLVGLVTYRRKEPFFLVIAATVCYLIIFSVPFLVIQRYGLPLVMLLVIPASAAVYGAWHAAGGLRRRVLLALPFVLAIVFQVSFSG